MPTLRTDLKVDRSFRVYRMFSTLGNRKFRIPGRYFHDCIRWRDHPATIKSTTCFCKGSLKDCRRFSNAFPLCSNFLLLLVKLDIYILCHFSLILAEISLMWRTLLLQQTGHATKPSKSPKDIYLPKFFLINTFLRVNITIIRLIIMLLM